MCPLRRSDRGCTSYVWSRSVKGFLYAVAAMWLLAGVSKAIALAVREPFLLDRDPVLRIQNAWLFAFVCQAEALGGAYLLFGSDLKRRLRVCTAASVGLLAYRISLGFIDPRIPCRCFGNSLSWFGMAPAASDLLAAVAVIICCVGSTLCWLWRASK